MDSELYAVVTLASPVDLAQAATVLPNNALFVTVTAYLPDGLPAVLTVSPSETLAEDIKGITLHYRDRESKCDSDFKALEDYDHLVDPDNWKVTGYSVRFPAEATLAADEARLRATAYAIEVALNPGQPPMPTLEEARAEFQGIPLW